VCVVTPVLTVEVDEGHATRGWEGGAAVRGNVWVEGGVGTPKAEEQLGGPVVVVGDAVVDVRTIIHERKSKPLTIGHYR
jgi:formylmethanofuran dehydrogenase subunit C